MRKIRLTAAVVALAALAVACSKADASKATDATPSPVPSASVNLPTQILGLRLVEEDVTKQLKRVGASYLDSISLFGFREQNTKKTLRATLQTGRFNSLADISSKTFRSRIVGQIGTSVPQELRVGRQPVYMSAGELQYTFLWFADRWLYVLTVRRDYPFARTLVRKLVEGSLLP